MTTKLSINIAFFCLVALTIASWGMNVVSGEALDHGASIIIATMVIGFFKVALIIAHFMEVKDAPRPLQIILSIWGVGVCTALTTMPVVM